MNSKVRAHPAQANTANVADSCPEAALLKELQQNLEMAAELRAVARLSTAALARRARSEALMGVDISMRRAQAAMAELAALSDGELAMARINGKA